MRHLSRIAIALSLIAVPTLLLAYFVRPSELLMAQSLIGKPMDFAFQMHGSYEGTSAALWTEGSTQGKDLESLELQMKVVVKGETKDGNAKANIQVRMKDQMLYFMLESLEATGVDELNDVSGIIRSRRWYSLSLGDLARRQETATGLDEERTKKIVAQILDALLQMNRTNQDDSSIYSMKIKHNAAVALKGLIERLHEQYPDVIARETFTNREVGDMRRILSNMYIHIKVITDGMDQPRAMKTYFTLNHEGASVVLQGWSAMRSIPVLIDVPINPQPLDDELGLPQPDSFEEDAAEPPAEDSSGSSNDAVRRESAGTILNAVHQYAIDHHGSLPGNISRIKGHICAMTGRRCREFVDLGALIGPYLESIPPDPMEQSVLGTGYWIWRNTDGTITVESRHAEGPDEISVTR